MGDVAPMNPLAQLVAIARLNLGIWKDHVHEADAPALGSTWLGSLPAGSTIETLPTNGDAVVYPSIELAGMAGMYLWLLGQADLDVVYANDLAYEIHGIDAVAARRSTGRFVVLEAKGTTRPFKHPGGYLAKTKHKGRQLSWDWCWSSTVDLAEHPSTAAAFLGLLGPMILGGVERMLLATKVEKVDEGYVVDQTSVWGDRELRRYPWMAQEKDWSRLRGWLGELE